MPKCVVGNTHHEDMCYEGIGLRAHNIDIIMGSIVNPVGRVRGSMWLRFEEDKNLWALISFAPLLRFPEHEMTIIVIGYGLSYETICEPI